MTAARGSFTLNGQNVNLKRGLVLSASNGAFQLNGQNATLTYSGAPAGNLVTFFRGISEPLNHGEGISTIIHELTDVGGGRYSIVYKSGISKDKTNSPNNEGYIIIP